MRMSIIVVVLCVATAACESSPPRASINPLSSHIQFSESDGLTMATAIVISGARTGTEGRAAEYRWIDEHLPGSTIGSQQIVGGEGLFDKFTVTLASGETRLLYFNITDFMHSQ